ncbi:N5-carboxyaminoimidazole ribonucleotide mutase [uncultured archaeon]|nr:N5-carboxyaminoimidazole ribonucleotide mutase [uncultured archaeon]
MEKVLIIMGSESDKEIAEKAEQVFKELGVSSRTEIASAHRNPDKVDALVKGTGADIIIAIAGLSAHLPGVCASKTIKPVIGVPIDAKLGGMDSLLSIVNMPPGIPVATVGIDNGKNAGLLAAQILAVSDKALQKKLLDYREKMKK